MCRPDGKREMVGGCDATDSLLEHMRSALRQPVSRLHADQVNKCLDKATDICPTRPITQTVLCVGNSADCSIRLA